MSKLNASLCKTKDIFEDGSLARFEIPSFQRRFVWTKENVKDMFDDFSLDSNDYSFKSASELDGYLFGSIVLIDAHDDLSYEIVDGQQRLTTISLIYKALSNLIDEVMEYDKSNYKTKKMRAYMDCLSRIYVGEPEEEVLRINQSSKLSYYELYKSIMNGSYSENDNYEIDPNICEVWEEINQQLSDFSIEKILKFKDYLDHNVMLIKIVCPSEDQAFQLFEVLNNRGQALEPLDLIKNMLLQKAIGSQNESEFDSYWKNFSENMYIKKNSRGQQKNYSSDFLKYFIMSRNAKNVQKNHLVSYFKGQIKDGNINSDNVMDLVKDLSNYSDIFNSIISNGSVNKFSNSSLMFIISQLDIVQFHQLFMVFYFSDAINEEKLQVIRERVLLSCIRMGVSTLYNRDLPNEIERRMPIIIDTFKKSIEHGNDMEQAVFDMIEVINEYNRSKSNSLRNTLPTLKLGKEKAMNLLKVIEVIINGNDGIAGRQSNGKKLTLEHILPQNQPDSIFKLGFDENDDYQSVINTIGNLTLLSKYDNSSLKDKTFELKNKEYGKTDLRITKALDGEFNSIAKSGRSALLINNLTTNYELSYEKENLWIKDCIDKRGKELTELIIDFVTGSLEYFEEK